MISQDGHLKMLGGYLEFFMDPALAEMYQSLRRELNELIQTKVSENSETIYYAVFVVFIFSRFLWLSKVKSQICMFLVFIHLTYYAE